MADWDKQWTLEPIDLDAPTREESTPRWRAQEEVVLERFGSFSGLRVIEIGAGRGTNALLYAKRGAEVTLLDLSSLALEQAATLFEHYGLQFVPRIGDVFALPDDLQDSFDLSMSFGLCEHFLGEQRLGVIRSHLDLLRPEGVAMLGVPNRWAPAYRLWMKALKMRGTWPLGTEVPFAASELRALAIEAGGIPTEPRWGSAVASLIDHGANQLLFKLHRSPLKVPQISIRGLDRLAYELLLPVVKPARMSTAPPSS
jgi:2-polyprenyl-3-methyl-5-hydroxy-6-metoxy-1,4-benzoquinol methylase